MAKKKRKTSQTRINKAKGRRLQQHVRDLFIRIGAEDPQDRLASEDIESTRMSQAGADVLFLSDRAKELFPFYIECKAARSGFNPHRFFESLSETAKKARKYPLLFHKRDHHDMLVTMDEYLFAVMLEYYVKEMAA